VKQGYTLEQENFLKGVDVERYSTNKDYKATAVEL
tara:strand:+ start:2952 stop:3056 length:105 start_codon:yes stop_codon:yes gene_type:complete